MKKKTIGISKSDEMQSWMLSLGFHLFVVFFSYLSHFIFNPSVDYKPSIRVDIVDLPDKFQEKMRVAPKAEPKPPTAPPVEQPKPKVEPKSKAINLNKKRTSAIEKLKTLKKVEQKVQRKKEQRSAIDKIKNNIKSEGAAMSGVHTDTKSDFNDYLVQVDQHIKSYWNLPRYLQNENYQTKILIKIDSDGYLVLKQIIESSGNSNYDDAVMKAVTDALPFPAPPISISGKVSGEGIIFIFP